MQGYLHMRVSPLLRIVITRSVALLPALTVAVMTRGNAGSTALDELNQWLNLVRWRRRWWRWWWWC
jgi:natural resistance-associated macrophage protein